MEQQKATAVWQYNNEEERQLAEYIIGLEKEALDKWFKEIQQDMKIFGQNVALLILMQWLLNVSIITLLSLSS